MASQGQEGLVPDNPLIAHTRQVWVADGYVPETYYTLSPEAAELLRPVFGSWGFDPSQAEFNFGWTPQGTAAYTVGNQVHINSDWWGEQTGLDRLALVAHEVTHSVQYQSLGYGSFLSRYAGEYNTGENYVVPGSLKATPIGQVDVVNSQFTLDQTAERSALEVRWRYGQ
jgi:hypothetical protein